MWFLGRAVDHRARTTPHPPRPIRKPEPSISVSLDTRVRHACHRASVTALLATLIWVGGGRPALAEPSLDPECLTVTRSSPATYMIENTGCAAESVLAAIELSTGRAEARCFTKKIRSQISIASEEAAPVVNYQCIEGARNCSVEILRGMFPECHAG